MRPSASDDEWKIIQSLLPASWEEAAKEQKAFRRVRYTSDAGSLLRLLLFHAVNDGGLRETVAQARASGIACMSQVALFKRHKQLLQLGHLPHKDPLAARSWIHAKLVVALLLERLYRNADSLSPWGYAFDRISPIVVTP